ncbi:MAG: hypothetical protein HYU85_05555 [Chloroflexi bacterium]|nr:hypothetical protein [Chloroflexota bacterium]MBI3931477.1 hypothetical protein [Chloroflexota bacterium]
MNITFLSNETSVNIFEQLHSKLTKKNVLKVRLAVSFLMKSGVVLLQKDLQKLISHKVPVDIIFGDDMGISESEALQKLLDINCSLSVFRGTKRRGYHPKLWIIDYADGNCVVCVGSPNLSVSGLKDNVEAAVLIEGSQQEVRSCLELWQTVKDSSETIDEDYIESYKNIENENKIRYTIRPSGKPDHSTNYKQLEGFVNGWMNYIEQPKITRRIEKWRGWYLLPSQGVVIIDKLEELGRVIRAIEKIPQYQKDEYVDVSTTKLGINNANFIIKNARVTYASKHTKAHVRDLFIRQQKNYLVHLGFLEEKTRGRITLTERGVELGAAIHDSEMREALSRSLMDISWPHGNIYFYPFLLELLSRMPDNRIYQDELDLFVIHTYNQTQIENRVEIMNMYRSLPREERLKFYNWAQGQLHGLLNTYRNSIAYGKYRGKIVELMVALGNTKELRLVKSKTAQRSYLTKRS